MKHFVERAIDGAILGKNGRWYKMFSDVGDIKLFKRMSNAQKYGLDKIPESMHKPELGNMFSIGTVHTLRDGDEVNICGQITRR
jgi:hypothetical protein